MVTAPVSAAQYVPSRGSGFVHWPRGDSPITVGFSGGADTDPFGTASPPPRARKFHATSCGVHSRFLCTLLNELNILHFARHQRRGEIVRWSGRYRFCFRRRLRWPAAEFQRANSQNLLRIRHRRLREFDRSIDLAWFVLPNPIGRQRRHRPRPFRFGTEALSLF